MDVADEDVQISLSPLKLEIIFKVNPADIRTQTLAALPHTHTHTVFIPLELPMKTATHLNNSCAVKVFPNCCVLQKIFTAIFSNGRGTEVPHTDLFI
jgi:hypothetical protein